VKKWLSIINYYNKETGLLHKILILVWILKMYPNSWPELKTSHSHACLTHTFTAEPTGWDKWAFSCSVF
jgi:hypothetical protein